MQQDDTFPTALITGASSGIGYEYARQLAAMGYNLILISNEGERLNQIADELVSEYGIQVTPFYADLSRPDAARQLYDYFGKRGFEVDILINNAGVFSFSDIADISHRNLKQMVNLHVVTPTLLCRYFGIAMRQRKHGYILNMSSLAAWTPYPGIAAYSATKAYLKTFSHALYNEMKPYNVGVTVVTPGAVATGLYRLSEKLKKIGIRAGIILTPEKLAKIALRGMFKRKKRVFPGFVNHLFVCLYPLLPNAFLRATKKKLAKYEW